MNDKKVAYTVKELACALNIGRNKAYELVKREDFPKIDMGGKIIIPKIELYKWLETNSHRC